MINIDEFFNGKEETKYGAKKSNHNDRHVNHVSDIRHLAPHQIQMKQRRED
jgi:hypothetical protein